MSQPPRRPRSTERLLADADERLRVTRDLPNRVEAIRGWAVNDQRSVRVTTTVHGALTDLEIAEQALHLGPDRLAQVIVRLAGEANRAALVQGVSELSPTLGDSGTTGLARAVGVGDLIEPDAPVVPYVPGVDPNAGTWTAVDPDEQPTLRVPKDQPTVRVVRDRPTESDDYALGFDFSTLRSDRPG